MKIGFFITARLKSSRLKEKILLDLNGKSVLDRVIERAKSVVGIDDVVLCTSSNSQDSVLYDNALKNKIKFFAGSENDVIKRLLNAAEYFGYDGFVSITADNPLFSDYLSNIMIDYYKRNNFDFGFIKGLPIGCMPYFLSTDALKIAAFMKEETDTEIWGPFIKRDDFFSICDFEVKNSIYNEKLRLTIDYPEDYKLFRKIFNNFNSSVIPNLNDVFDLLETNPNLLEITKHLKQTSIAKQKLKSINETFNANRKKGIKFAKEHNILITPKYSKVEVVI